MDIVTASPLRMVFTILFLVLCVFFFLTGVPLNGYVLFITSCRVERTVSGIWFLNQAVADLIFIIFLPLKCTSIFILHLDWAERLNSTITSLHLFSSAFFLMALSVHRCILVTHPVWARNHCTPRLAVWVVLVMWALSFGFSFHCSDLWEPLRFSDRIRAHFRLDEWRLKVAVAFQFLVGFLIPLTLILIPTFYILLAAKRRRNRLSQANKQLKILLVLIPSFFICWFPYHVISFLLIAPTSSPSLRITEHVIASVLTYFNSCLNPILYLIMEEEFLRYLQRAHNPQISAISGLEPPE